MARTGLASNVPSEALYPETNRDARGRILDGRHTYTVTFARGQLPPVRAFWSLTLYDQHRPPAGTARANWLPAPSGRFWLYLRLFEPGKAAVDGSWTPPTVTRRR